MIFSVPQITTPKRLEAGAAEDPAAAFHVLVLQ